MVKKKEINIPGADGRLKSVGIIMDGNGRWAKARGAFYKQKATIDLQRATIDNVCQAVIELSRSKTGALIVMERRVKLDDVARSGVELDAKTSQYLLRNIFVDKAPSQV